MSPDSYETYSIESDNDISMSSLHSTRAHQQPLTCLVVEAGIVVTGSQVDVYLNKIRILELIIIYVDFLLFNYHYWFQQYQILGSYIKNIPDKRLSWCVYATWPLWTYHINIH